MGFLCSINMHTQLYNVGICLPLEKFYHKLFLVYNTKLENIKTIIIKIKKWTLLRLRAYVEANICVYI